MEVLEYASESHLMTLGAYVPCPERSSGTFAHTQHFMGVSSHGRCCFAFSKQGLGKLIGQEDGLTFTMSGE
jgi:hypothetical protein